MLEIKNLHASVEGKEILRGVNLTIRDGEVHALLRAQSLRPSTFYALSCTNLGNK